MLKSPPPDPNTNGGSGSQTISLFLGNLSMFINEDDIETLFSQFSGITPGSSNKKIEAKIIRTEKMISLGYGFINMRNEIEAEAAMKALNGRQFHGRPLQINWAVRNIKKVAPAVELDMAIINSVHVKFTTLNRGHLVTEETLQHHFARYGTVIDVFVKYSCFNKVTGLQKGYAFVHYDASAEGKQSAIVAAAEATGNSLVHFDCQPSNNLLRQFVQHDADEDCEKEEISDKYPFAGERSRDQNLMVPSAYKQNSGSRSQNFPHDFSPSYSTSSAQINTRTSAESQSAQHSDRDRDSNRDREGDRDRERDREKGSMSRSRGRTQGSKNTHPVGLQAPYSQSFPTPSSTYFNPLVSNQPSGYNNISPHPITYIDPYSTSSYVLSNQQQQQGQIYQQYQQQSYQQQRGEHQQLQIQLQAQQQLQQQQQQQYDRNQALLYQQLPPTLITHPDAQYMYTPVQHPRYTPVMPHRPQRHDTGSLHSSPMNLNLNVMGSSHVGYMYPQSREQSLNYRTQPQVDSRFQPQLYNSPAYTAPHTPPLMNAPVPAPYGYRHLSSQGSTPGHSQSPTPALHSPANEQVSIEDQNQ